jgi:hypothetical protein
MKEAMSKASACMKLCPASALNENAIELITAQAVSTISDIVSLTQ